MRSYSIALGAVTAALTALAGLQPAAHAQGYPTRPITMVVPFAAGGPTDAVARLMSDHMSRTVGQQIVIENVAGAGGTAGTERVAKANPDGYTVLLHHSGITAAPALYSNLRFDTKAFEMLGTINSGPMVMLAKKGIEVKTAAELFDYLKKNADKVTLGHAGVGSNSHVCGLLLQSALATNFKFVAYRGTGPAMNDLVAGQIDAMCDQSTNAVPQITGGTIRALMVLDDKRIDSIKEVPHAKEAGFEKLQMTIWHGLYAPKGFNPEAAAKLHDALKKALADKAITDKFAAVGTSAFAVAEQSPDAHRKRFLDSIEMNARLLSGAGVKPSEAK
jgi:tripartite-type tricarboxylate transporter receptor subunit TctC